MPNDLYNQLSKSSGQANDGGFSNFVRQFSEFKAKYQGDPQVEIQRMLQSGKISQEQLDKCQRLAQQIMQHMPR